jgi:hypothetical protein
VFVPLALGFGLPEPLVGLVHTIRLKQSAVSVDIDKAPEVLKELLLAIILRYHDIETLPIFQLPGILSRTRYGHKPCVTPDGVFGWRLLIVVA